MKIDVQHVSFEVMLKVTFTNKMTIRKNTSNYLDARWICVWCHVRHYIGMPYSKMPEDVRAYFLSPQQYKEYEQIIENLKESVR